MRYLILMAVATALVCGGCSHVLSIKDGGTDSDTDTDTDTDTDADTDTDTGPIECNLGEYSGNFTIDDQSDVAFLAGYTSISGRLRIICDSCTDLSGLICIASVGVDLRIENNDVLYSLIGLSGLTSVGGSLIISENDALSSLISLSALTSVGGELWIFMNLALTNLTGLSGITSTNYGLKIQDNDALTNLDGLSGITSVGGDLIIGSQFSYGGNPVLANLDGLSNILSVAGDLTIFNNDLLPDCEACDLLDQFASAPITIYVHDNLDDSCTPVPAGCP